MRNLHLIILQEFGIEARCLLREWERLRLRSSDYKNHRIFSLRCIYKELIPVSIKLKSTLDTPKARHIIRKAEKDLLQARIKAINNILVQVERETQDCRAKLALIILQERLEQYQHFINKVSELRFNKVKQRQINKLNHLVSKKEGNITNNITLNRQVQSLPNSRNPTPATALLPPGEGDNSPQATVHPPLEGNSSFNNQASNNNNTTSNSVNSNPVSNQTNSQGPSHNQTPAIAHLPPGEGSNSPLGAVQLPLEATSSPPQPRSTTAREENNSSQANSPPATNNPQSHRASQSGHSSNPPRASRQGTRHSPRHQPTQPSPEACTTSREGTPSSTPPSRSSQGSSNEEPNPKWVINLSNKPLTPAQRSVLAKGPNFAVTPRQPPNLEYITAIEAACTKLSQQDAEELRADVNRVLRSSHPPKPNLTKAQNHSSKGT